MSLISSRMRKWQAPSPTHLHLGAGKGSYYTVGGGYSALLNYWESGGYKQKKNTFQLKRKKKKKAEKKKSQLGELQSKMWMFVDGIIKQPNNEIWLYLKGISSD